MSLIYNFFLNVADVPLDKLLKDPVGFQKFLYDTTNLSPKVVTELYNSTVNVQKVCSSYFQVIHNLIMLKQEIKFILRQIQTLFIRKGGCLDYQIVVPEMLKSW